MTDEPYQITERGDPRDRIHNQRPLFDVDRTTTAQCQECGATREPTDARAEACEYDEWQTDFALRHMRRRPKGCLNAHDPAHAPFPEGF